MKIQTKSRRTIAVLAVAAVFMMSANLADGQTVHKLLHGDAPPGVAADTKVMQNPSLAFHRQPVRISAPQGSFVAVWSGQGFGSSMSNSLTGAFNIGPVYRLQVTQIHRHPGRELYPSIEILDRLYSPQGVENNFPVEVEISQDDLEQALAGRLVTKVIYLEDPSTALPVQRVPGDQPTIDVSATSDAIQTAESMGRAMAILRIGSRVPSFDDHTREFEFHGQPVEILAEPGMGAVRMSDDMIQDALPPIINQSTPPPIITGDDFKSLRSNVR